MTKSEYQKQRNDIFSRANERGVKIIEKYKNNNGEGFLDGEPWAKELKEDSKKVLEELQQLDKNYAENN